MTWLSGWQYRKSHTITGTTAGVQTNYQVGIKVYYGSGTDGTESVGGITFAKVYCNSYCKPDFGDIRFALSDGTPLDYWVESQTNGDNAVIWVEVDSIPASPSTKDIYLYYGKADATTTSNGANTSVYFDDMQSDTSANYTTLNGATKSYDSVNKYLQQTNTGEDQHWLICNNDTLPTSYVFQATIKITSDPFNRKHGGITADFSTSAITGYRLTHLDTNYVSNVWVNNSESGLPNGSIGDSSLNPVNNWLKYRVYRNRTSGLLNFEVTNDLTLISLNNTTTTIDTGHLGFHSYGSNLLIKNIFVRNYCSPEPVHTYWGTEETQSQPYTLTISSTIGGETYPKADTYSYISGTNVTVAAYPEGGYGFSHWSIGGVNYTQNPIVVTVNADQTLSPVFLTASSSTVHVPYNGRYAGKQSKMTVIMSNADPIISVDSNINDIFPGSAVIENLISKATELMLE